MRRADAALLAVLCVLFVVPAAVLLLGDPPSRFGFQMYSGYGAVTATWVDDGGTRRTVDLGDHLASPRIEVEWTQRLPQQLCGRLPGAVSVEVRQTAAGDDRVREERC